jgi:hypothetical protein
MRRSLGLVSVSRPMRFLASLALPPLLQLPPGGPWVRGDWPAGEAATYTRAGTALPFVISELPGERAEAPCNGSVGVHGGRARHFLHLAAGAAALSVAP